MPDIFISDKDKKEKIPSKAKEESKTVSGEKKKSLSKKDRKYVYKLQSNSFNPLSAFIYCPRDANFVNKDPEEKIVLLLRKHPITNLGWILLGIIMLFAPGVLGNFPILDFLPDRFQFMAVLVWYLITVAYVFEKFLSWFFNVNIITDERIFDVDFVNLTYREMTDANIDQIQDVTVKMGSVIRTVFNYGDVQVQTAAEIPEIVFEAVPKPDEVAKILRELRVEEEEEKIEGRVR